MKDNRNYEIKAYLIIKSTFQGGFLKGHEHNFFCCDRQSKKS